MSDYYVKLCPHLPLSLLTLQGRLSLFNSCCLQDLTCRRAVVFISPNNNIQRIWGLLKNGTICQLSTSFQTRNRKTVNFLNIDNLFCLTPELIICVLILRCYIAKLPAVIRKEVWPDGWTDGLIDRKCDFDFLFEASMQRESNYSQVTSCSFLNKGVSLYLFKCKATSFHSKVVFYSWH